MEPAGTLQVSRALFIPESNSALVNARGRRAEHRGWKRQDLSLSPRAAKEGREGEGSTVPADCSKLEMSGEEKKLLYVE